MERAHQILIKLDLASIDILSLKNWTKIHACFELKTEVYFVFNFSLFKLVICTQLKSQVKYLELWLLAQESLKSCV